MIRYTTTNEDVLHVDSSLLDRPDVGAFLEALERSAPDLAFRWDSAIVAGALASMAVKQGRFDDFVAEAGPTFARDDLEVLALAALAELFGGDDVPDPWRSWILASRAAAEQGIDPEDLVERLHAELLATEE